MSVTQALAALRQRWIVVLVLIAFGGVAAWTYSVVQTPIYNANVQLFVSVSGQDSGTMELNQGSSFTQQRVKSYMRIVTSPAVMDAVIAELELPYTLEELDERITVSSPLDTVLLEITVEDESPNRARDIANAIAREFPKLVAQIETHADPSTSTRQAISPVKVAVTREAELPDDPVLPRTGLNIALGLILGVGFGVGGAILRHNLDKTIRSKSVAAEAAGAPVLGVIADVPKLTNKLIADEHATPRAEAFRQLRTNIRFLSIDQRLSSFVVTGSLPEEGKTTTTANLAIALAQSGQPVALVDGDLRKPTVADVFALSNGVGLTNVLLGDVPVNQALQHWRPDMPLYVLAAGPRPPNPSELLGSFRLTKIVESLVASGMTVVFDSPPLLPVTDAAIIARVTGGALVVTRVGSTRTDQLTTAVETLRNVGANVLGVVANRVKGKKETSYSSYYDVPAPRRPRAKR